MSRTARIFSNITNLDYLQSARSFKYKNLDLQHLAEQVKTGRFKFSPLQMAKVPKTNNRYRIICMPSDKDKFVQQVLLKNLSSKEEDVFHVHSSAVRFSLLYSIPYPSMLVITKYSYPIPLKTESVKSVKEGPDTPPPFLDILTAFVSNS